MPLEPEEESRSCPYCGEPFEPDLDLSEREGETIQDCDVCCRPVTIRFRFDGEDLVECELLREDDP